MKKLFLMAVVALAFAACNTPKEETKDEAAAAAPQTECCEQHEGECKDECEKPCACEECACEECACTEGAECTCEACATPEEAPVVE